VPGPSDSPAPPPVIDPAWAAVPPGGPVAVDIAGRDQVIHRAGGGAVVAAVPDRGPIQELRRVHGGWVIAYYAGLRRWAMVAEDGRLAPIDGRTGPGLLAVSPDGELAAVLTDESRIDLVRLPGLTVAATLALRPEQTAGHVSGAHFAGGVLLVNTVRLGDSEGTRRILTAWRWADGRTASHPDLTARAGVAGVAASAGSVSVAGVAASAGSVSVAGGAALALVDPYEGANSANARKVADAGYLLMAVRDDLGLRRLGCVPPGEWRLSPDGTRLAGLCSDRPCAAVLSVPELVAGRPGLTRVVELPLFGFRVDWADDAVLHVVVLLAVGYDRTDWGLLRCPLVSACTRPELPTGPTAAAIDVAGF
jgi:hypothetical protein